MNVDIWSLVGEWQFSSKEIIEGKNVLDLGEKGIFRCHRVEKGSETWVFCAHGEWRGKYAILEFVLSRDELTNPKEMTAGEILSFPRVGYVLKIVEMI